MCYDALANLQSCFIKLSNYTGPYYPFFYIIPWTFNNTICSQISGICLKFLKPSFQSNQTNEKYTKKNTITIGFCSLFLPRPAQNRLKAAYINIREKKRKISDEQKATELINVFFFSKP